MRRFLMLAFASFMMSCSTEDTATEDPIVPDNTADNVDPAYCQRACDALAGAAEGTCGACVGSCDAAPAACRVYFACLLEPGSDPTTCDTAGACEGILDQACADWRG